MSIDSTLTRRMTIANDVNPEKKFIPSALPWVLAAGALLVYLGTLNRWVSFVSVNNLAMVSGWNWRPELTRPLYWLVTYPIRLLPPNLIPLALNLFSALCAGLSLALLARSVALLPHDRTEDQRIRERNAFGLLSIRSAWLPPVLAVLVCGLQLSFWENATAASSEIFDLLLFAYVLRCLLEFRLYGVDSWLLRAALVYGAAMTNNWAMIGFFPLFLAALVWLRGISFFNLRFLRQMFVAGTIGLCFYLLLPAVASGSTAGQLGFWQALKLNLGNQKSYVAMFLFNKALLFQSDRPLWVLALPSLLPVIAMSFRWPSYFGDPSKLGVTVATFVFHFLHALLLLVCVWVAMDPQQFGPRNYQPGLLDYGMWLLPMYYLGALSVGYYSGYFLLVFGGAPPRLRERPLPGYPAFLNTLVACGIWLLLLALPAALVYRNLPQIRTTNGPMLRQYGELMAQNVSPRGSVILSEDPIRLALLKSVWTQESTVTDTLLLDTSALPEPAYQRFLKKQNPKRWTSPLDPERKEVFPPPYLQQLVVTLSTNSSIYYLHPSFGYYFEKFYPEPHGVVYKMIRYPANTLSKPSLSHELLTENQAFWAGLDTSLLKSATESSPSVTHKEHTTLLDRVAGRVGLFKEPNRDALRLAPSYSRALDFWGVELQRNGLLPEAAVSFNRAKELNTENVAAEVNLLCNRSLQAGEKSVVRLTRWVEEQLGRYVTVQNVMNFNGPFDEASFCFLLGREFFGGGNYRQAAQEFQRVTVLAPEEKPENLASRLMLARASLLIGAPDDAVKAVSEIHARGQALGVCRTNAPDLLEIEAYAQLIKGDSAALQTVVESAIGKYPDDEDLLAKANEIYMNAGVYNSGFYSNALNTIDRQLKIRPENTGALVNKGLAWLRLGEYSNAIPPLTQVVQLGTNNAPRIYYAGLYNRGIAFWKSENLDAAQKDFEILQKAFPAAAEFSYGLADIAYRRKDTNAAVRNYQLFLAATPQTNAPETSNALQRLKELRRFPR